MEAEQVYEETDYYKLFAEGFPHILEKIIFSGNYSTYKKCLRIDSYYRKTLTTERYITKGKTVFKRAIKKDERKLSKTARNNNTREAKKLLASGMIDVNEIVHGHLEWTPLHEAAKYGSYEMTKLLIKRGADLDPTDINGETPLHRAAIYGQEGVTHYLIEKGANVNAITEGGTTPLHWAARSNFRITHLLIGKGAELNVRNNDGETPLHWAVERHTKATGLLIDNGADMEERDNMGNAPLHWAAKKGRSKEVRLLITKGANVRATNVNGETPLHLLSSPTLLSYGTHIELAQMLVSNGADEDAIDNFGYAPEPILDLVDP